MIGSEVVVAIAGSLVSFNSYRINGKDIGLFTPIDNVVPVKDTGACEYTDASTTWTVARFTRSLSSGNNPISQTDATPIVIAYGTTDTMAQHSSSARGAYLLNLATAELTVPAVAQKASTLRIVHGALMFAGFGVFIPVGVIIARYGKQDIGDAWFVIHALVQVFGYFISFAAFLIALYMVSGAHFTTKAHSQLGLAVVVGGVLQLTLGFFRPGHVAKGSYKPNARVVWEIVHKWFGRLLNVVVIITIFFGLYQYAVPTGLYIAYAVYVGVMILLIIGLEIRKRVLKSRQKRRGESLVDQELEDL